ncbi:MAG TPA: hypothetical protein VGT44_04750 [Ktedonobacteraceae bacterium]|nr:hypothetical protein [Ktedonobacteraceae bacterium]
MSQQMHYDEAERERQGAPIDHYDAGYQGGYRDPYAGGQKISFGNTSFQDVKDKTASAGQRLALAIVSVAMLVPLAGIIMGTTFTQFFSLVGGLIAMAIVCVTIMVINIVFNFRH